MTIPYTKLSQGRSVDQVSCDMGITEQTYYRWRKEYSVMKTVQVKRLKDLEQENGRLKKAIAELTLFCSISGVSAD
jgi:putative transposase